MKKRGADTDIDGPQKVGPGQVLKIEHYNSGSVGTKKRWKNFGEHPLTLAHHRGQITDAMFDAGQSYRKAYEVIHRSGRDSTQMINIGGRSGLQWSDERAAAERKIKRFDDALPKRSRVIVRAFCGEGASAAAAVLRIVPLHRPQGVMDRLREALADLVEVVEGRKAA